MKNEQIAVTVHILDKEYQVACSVGEEHILKESAQLLNNKMREIRDKGSIVGNDRIAVMAALNIAHELLEIKPLEKEYISISDKILDLQKSVASTLQHAETQPELI